MKCVLVKKNNSIDLVQIANEDYTDINIKQQLSVIYGNNSTLPYKAINYYDLPIVSPFFKAYKLNEKFLTSDNPADYLDIDYEVAKSIWKEKMREARESAFPGLDVKYMRALESGDTALIQSIVEQKNILRDAPDLPLPDDLEGIKQVWPEVLGSKPV